MEKKLTLNQTWVYCLRMWRWIARERERGSRAQVATLKRKWLRNHGFKDVHNDCFFCCYGSQQPSTWMSDCVNCPGRLVDPKFDCYNNDYDYLDLPVEFYKELLRLNRIRKGKGETGLTPALNALLGNDFVPWDEAKKDIGL